MSIKTLSAALAIAGTFATVPAARALLFQDLIRNRAPAAAPTPPPAAAKPSLAFCKADEFEKACVTLDRIGGRGCAEPDPLSLKSADSVQKFLDRVSTITKKAEAAALVRAKYMPCLGDEAYKQHRVDCAPYLKEAALTSCDAATGLYRKAWEEGVRAAERALVDAAIERAPDRAGQSRLREGRESALGHAASVVRALEEALRQPNLAVAGADLTQVAAKIQAHFAAQDAKWASAAEQAAQEKSLRAEAARKEREARRAAADAAELESAKNVVLPKAKMKSKALSATFAKLVERRWPGEKALRVILSSARWEVARNKWTGIITGRVTDAHIVVQQPSGRCRLFRYGLHQPREIGGWGETSLNGVGESERVLCERFGAVEVKSPQMADAR